MLKCYRIIVLLVIIQVVYQHKIMSQNTPVTQELKGKPAKDRLLVSSEEKHILFVSKENFNEVFNNHISYILTGDKNLSNLGSYISINPAKPTATVSIAKPFFHKEESKYTKPDGTEAKQDINKIKRVLSGTVTGGVTDNAVAFFKNDRFNTSVEGRVNISNILSSKFYYFPSDKKKMDAQRTRLDIFYRNQRKILALEEQKLTEDITTLQFSRKTEDKIKLTKTELQLSNLKEHGLDKLNKVYKDSLKSIEIDANWSTIRVAWLDLFGQVKQQKVYLYDSTRTFTKRINDTDFTGYKIGIGISLLWDSRAKYWKMLNGLIRAEYGLSRANNIIDLTTMDISTVFKSDSTNLSRSITEKTSAYDFKKYTKSYYHDLRLDGIKAFNNQIALHFNYNLLLPFDKKSKLLYPKYGVNSITAGLIIAFTNKEDKKSKLNIEPYIRFKDLSNKYSSDYKNFYQRNEVGIFLTLPIAYRLGRVTDK